MVTLMATMPWTMEIDMNLTKQQRKALKRVFDRGPIERPDIAKDDYRHRYPVSVRFMSYRQFRRTVTMGCNCIMVPWCGMWLGIELDGYTHS